jgi:hypothetical protein
LIRKNFSQHLFKQSDRNLVPPAGGRFYPSYLSDSKQDRDLTFLSEGVYSCEYTR